MKGDLFYRDAGITKIWQLSLSKDNSVRFEIALWNDGDLTLNIAKEQYFNGALVGEAHYKKGNPHNLIHAIFKAKSILDERT